MFAPELYIVEYNVIRYVSDAIKLLIPLNYC